MEPDRNPGRKNDPESAATFVRDQRHRALPRAARRGETATAAAAARIALADPVAVTELAPRRACDVRPLRQSSDLPPVARWIARP
jgi:hypothetical protein